MPTTERTMKPNIKRALSDAQNMLARLATALVDIPPADMVDIGHELKAIENMAGEIVGGWFHEKDRVKVLDKPGIRQLCREFAKPDTIKPRLLITMGASFRAIYLPTTQPAFDYKACERLLGEEVYKPLWVSKPVERFEIKPLDINQARK